MKYPFFSFFFAFLSLSLFALAQEVPKVVQASKVRKTLDVKDYTNVIDLKDNIAFVRDLKHGDEVICKVNLGRFGFHKFSAVVAEIPPPGMASSDFIFWITTDDPRMNEIRGFAGMSGSPVYFKDKLVGAIGYGYSSLRKFHGGVTPAELFVPYFSQIPFDPPQGYNLKAKFSPIHPHITSLFSLQSNFLSDVFLHKNSPSTVDDFLRSFSLEHIFQTKQSHFFSKNLSSFQTLQYSHVTPLPFLDFSSSIIQSTSRASDKISLPYSGENPFFEGAPCAIPLVVGDVFLNSSGTVTAVKDDKIALFGHPFFNFGHIKMPLYTFSPSETLTSYGRARWIGSVGQHAGTLFYDGKHAVVARFEKIPTPPSNYMWPVELSISLPGQKSRNFSFSFVKHNELVFLLPQACENIISSIIEFEKFIDPQFLLPLLEIQVFSSDPQKPPLIFKKVIAHKDPFMINIAFYEFIVRQFFPMFQNDLFSTDVSKFVVRIDYKKLDQVASILHASADKSIYRPGEIANILLELRNDYGNNFYQTVAYKIPNHVSANHINIYVGPQRIFQSRKKSAQFGSTLDFSMSSQQLINLNLNSYQRLHHALSDNFSFYDLSVWSEVQDESSFSINGYKYNFAPLFQKIHLRKNDRNDPRGKLVVRGNSVKNDFVIAGNVVSLPINIKHQE